jgi:hypothetical protein
MYLATYNQLLIFIDEVSIFLFEILHDVIIDGRTLS